MARMRGTAAQGRVDAYDLQIASPSVTASQMGRLGFGAAGPDTQIPAGAWTMPYAVPHLRVQAFKTPELAPISSWRSVGASTAGFFAEGFLDELIHAAGGDPMEERLRMVNTPLARAVLEEVAAMSDWGSDLGPNRGRGVAMVHSFGVDIAEVIEVTNTDAGIRIDKVFVAAEVGRVVDPVNFENNVKGGVVWGLGHAMNSEMTYADGMVEQANYYDTTTSISCDPACGDSRGVGLRRPACGGGWIAGVGRCLCRGLPSALHELSCGQLRSARLGGVGLWRHGPARDGRTSG